MQKDRRRLSAVFCFLGSVPSVLFSLLLLSQLVLPLFFRFPLLTAEGFALLLVRFLL